LGGSRYWGLTCDGGGGGGGDDDDDDDIVIIIQAENEFCYFFVLTFYRVLESDGLA
jgi:hypothetical protein